MKDTLVRLKHTAKLEKLIEDGASYDEILKQSQILDKYISMEMNTRKNKLNKSTKEIQ